MSTASKIPAGRAWKYGDNIDTDQLAPIGSYKGTTDAEIAEGAVHCLRALDPGFAKSVAAGDVFVAGNNMGIGSSRDSAPFFLKTGFTKICPVMKAMNMSTIPKQD